VCYVLLVFGSTLTLFKLLLADDTEVGRWHNRSLGCLSGHTAHPAYLELSDDILQDANDIIFAFLYLRIKDDDDDDEDDDDSE
jgi:hypothetical protein